MAKIIVTEALAKHLILKAMGLDSTYRADADILITDHTVEITDGKARP